MAEENKMTLPSYIQNSLMGAWKFVRKNPEAMKSLDFSSDGFWKSFWSIGVMTPIFALWIVFNLNVPPIVTQGGVELSFPILSTSVYFFTAMPLTAFVMAYFTKFMKISEHYASMVIAFNWVNALSYIIMTIATVLLFSDFMGGQISAIILMMLKLYFGFYVLWFTLKTSLQISGMLAAGVLLFVKIFDTVLQVLAFRIFDPVYFEAVIYTFNNQPV